MLVTVKHSELRKAPPPSQKKPAAPERTIFPFQGATPYGIFTAPFVYDRLKQVVGTAWAALNLRSNQIAALKWKVFKTDPSGKKPDVELPLDHWAVQFLRNPSGFMRADRRTPSQIWKLLYEWAVISGTSYNLAQKNKAGFPQVVYPLETSYVQTIATGANDYMPSYRYTSPYGVFNYDFDDIYIYKRLSPTPYIQWNLFYGQSEFQFYGHAIDTEMQALLYQDAMFANGADPSFVLKQPATDEGASQAQIHDFRNQWNEERQGAANAGKYAILPPGWEPQELHPRTRESDFLETIQSLRQYIAACMGVPLAMLDGTYNSRAAAEVVTDYFLMNVIAPDAKLLAESLTQYLNMFEINLRVGYEDLTHRSLEETAIIVSNLQKIAGGINGNEARQMFVDGMPEVPQGEVYTTMNNQVSVDDMISGATLPNKPQPEPNKPEPVKE